MDATVEAQGRSEALLLVKKWASLAASKGEKKKTVFTGWAAARNKVKSGKSFMGTAVKSGRGGQVTAVVRIKTAV